MELIPIQEDILINPEQITAIERRVAKNSVSIRVYMVDGKSYDVVVPTKEFMYSCSRAGVNLGKQFFSV